MAKKNKKKALGRGLSALLDDPQNEIRSISDSNADRVVGNIIDLDLKKIEVNPFQPRTNFNEEAILELATRSMCEGIKSRFAVLVDKMVSSTFAVCSSSW